MQKPASSPSAVSHCQPLPTASKPNGVDLVEGQAPAALPILPSSAPGSGAAYTFRSAPQAKNRRRRHAQSIDDVVEWPHFGRSRGKRASAAPEKMAWRLTECPRLRLYTGFLLPLHHPEERNTASLVDPETDIVPAVADAAEPSGGSVQVHKPDRAQEPGAGVQRISPRSHTPGA